ncbi:MAG TPA: ATP phosphoribosyltransferase regulatory subunit, partial [Methylophilaceae bacterium]|nr:ATP phosphoribosyltransferase regulatory subunit [Methylophilaceae bacterium]
TGFSLDLRGVVTALPLAEQQKGILDPYSTDTNLLAKIDALRASGQIVVQELPGHEAHKAELNCDRALVKTNSGWEVVPAGKKG